MINCKLHIIYCKVIIVNIIINEKRITLLDVFLLNLMVAKTIKGLKEWKVVC